MSHMDLVVFIEHSDGLDAGGVRFAAVAVTDRHAETISREDLLHQPVRALSLETVVGSIERQIVRISPSLTDAFAFIVETAAIVIIHFDWGKVVRTHYGLGKCTHTRCDNDVPIFTSSCTAATLVPSLSMLSGWHQI